MLRSHGSGDTEDFVLMTQILLSMPLFGQDVYMEFLTKWNEWQVGVRISENNFSPSLSSYYIYITAYVVLMSLLS